MLTCILKPDEGKIVSLEMDPSIESTVIAKVCNKLNMKYFTFYYAGDNLDGTVWDKRSLNGLVNIDKKKEVLLLALELALVIWKKEVKYNMYSGLLIYLYVIIIVNSSKYWVVIWIILILIYLKIFITLLFIKVLQMLQKI